MKGKAVMGEREEWEALQYLNAPVLQYLNICKVHKVHNLYFASIFPLTFPVASPLGKTPKSFRKDDLFKLSLLDDINNYFCAFVH